MTAERDTPEDDYASLILVFTVEGQVLLEEDGELVWASDDDDDFAVEFQDEFLDADADAKRVLEYLEEEGLVEEDEKEHVAIEQEVDGDGEDET